MGYAASVGAMIFDEMATVNEQAENRMDALNTALVVAEDKIAAGQEWSERHVRAVREMDRLLQLNIRMHKLIMELRTAVRHSRDNPIVIDDDEEEQEEGEIVDAAPGSPARTLVEGEDRKSVV